MMCRCETKAAPSAQLFLKLECWSCGPTTLKLGTEKTSRVNQLVLDNQDHNTDQNCRPVPSGYLCVFGVREDWD